MFTSDHQPTTGLSVTGHRPQTESTQPESRAHDITLLAIRAELPETEITHQNCDRLFVEGFSLLKQRHAALLNITENVSASALSNILTQNKIYSHRKQRLAAVAATPPASKRYADIASRSAMPPSKHARVL